MFCVECLPSEISCGSAVSGRFLCDSILIMVQIERRRGLLFSVIILGAVVSGSVYYYIRDYWNIEAKVGFRFRNLSLPSCSLELFYRELP